MFERLRSFLLPDDAMPPPPAVLRHAHIPRHRAVVEARVEAMARIHGLDPAFARTDPALWDDMLQRCATCAGRGYCNVAFSRHDAEVPDDIHFCPNREDLDDLLLRQALE